MKKEVFVTTLLGMTIGIVFGIVSYKYLVEIERISSYFYTLYHENVINPVLSFLSWGISSGIIMLWLFYKYRVQLNDPEPDVKVFLKFSWPGLLYLPLLAMKVNFFGSILFLLITGLWGMNIFGRLKGKSFDLGRKGLWIIVGLALVMTVCGFIMQYIALDRLYMIGCDMQVFLGAARGLLNEKGFQVFALKSSLGIHFFPTLILFLAPWVWLFPNMYTLPLINSLLLYSCPVLLYWFCRRLKLSYVHSFILAVCMCFSASLACLNISLIYGFHDVVLMMPLLIGYFIARESGKKGYIISWIIFAVSLMVKETVPVFWFGMGVVYFIQGKRRDGIIISSISIIFFLVALKIIIPWFAAGNDYMFSNHYSELGGSIIEIALSPFARPQIFFGYLLRTRCFYFLLLLLLPVFFLTLRYPLLLCGGAITFLFICLNNGEVQNISMQYQAEIVCLIFINAAYSLKRINEQQNSSEWWKQSRAFLAAAVITSLGSWYFYGEFFTGKSSLKPVMSLPSWGDEIKKIQQLVPVGEKLATSTEISYHFFWRNIIGDFKRNHDPYVLMNLYSKYIPVEITDNMRYYYLSNGYRVIYSKAQNKTHLILLTNTGSVPALESGLGNAVDYTMMPGIAFNSGIPEVSAKYNFVRKGHDNEFQVGILLNQKISYDLEIKVNFKVDAGELQYQAVFGNGITPAFMAPSGSFYQYSIILPDLEFQNFRISITPGPPVSLP